MPEQMYICDKSALDDIANAIISYGKVMTTLSFPDDFIQYLKSVAHYGAAQVIVKNSKYFQNFENCMIMSIPGSYFSGLTMMKTASCEQCSIIGSCGFYKCTNLSSIYFPECISVLDSAFESCASLTNVYLPKCEKIYYKAFHSCTRLVSVSIPLCSYLGAAVFQLDSALTSIYMPNVQFIGSWAFKGCSSLSVVDCIASMISSCAFSDCKNLKSLYLRGSSVAYLRHSSTFYGVSYSKLKIYVPSSLYEAYLSAHSSSYSVYRSMFVSF